MADVDPSEIISELASLVDDELKVVSYKWLARHFSIPANMAKRILYQFSEDRKGDVKTNYLLCGCMKDSGQVVSIVDSSQLQESRSKLDIITSLHVYSVAPLHQADALTLWQHDLLQTQELLKDCLEGRDSASVKAFKDNTCSSVRFVPTVRAKRPGVRPAEALQEAVKPAAPVLAAAAPSSSLPTAAPPAALSMAGAPASADVETTVASKKAKPAPAPLKAPGKKANTLAGMWGKAGPVKKVAEQAAAQAGSDAARGAMEEFEAAAMAAAAAAAVQAADDADEAPSPVVAAKRSKRMVQIQDSDDDDGVEDAAPAASIAVADAPLLEEPHEEPATAVACAAAAVTPADEVMNTGGAVEVEEVKDADQPVVKKKGGAAAGKRKKAGEEAVEKPNKRSKAKAKPSAVIDTAVADALDIAEEVVCEDKGSEEQPAQPPAASFFGSTQPSQATGAKRRVETITLNEKGEEVTEVVWEEDGEARAVAPAPAAVASKPVAAASSGRGSGGSKAATSKASTGLKAKGNSGAQKGIMSFFGKK